jgi:hypothetical protein
MNKILILFVHPVFRRSKIIAPVSMSIGDAHA